MDVLTTNAQEEYTAWVELEESMRLFVLFGIPEGKGYPKALVVVDSRTIQESGNTDQEYKDLVEEAVLDGDEKYERMGWYTIGLPQGSENTLIHELRQLKTSFSGKIEPAPKPHPSIEGITVQVGRIPGKIRDDEIFD